MSAVVAQSVKPAYLHIPPFDYTDGDQVAGLAEDMSFGPDDAQRLCLDAIFAKDERAKSAAFEIWMIACRQNLKTGCMIQAVLGWAFLFKEDPIIWTAHEWDPAISESFLNISELISGYRWAARQVRYMHRGERQQEIGLRNGARILFKTRTPGAGRALAGAKTVLDEGWAIKNAHMGALIPTMSARSITGDPQVLGGSSAAREDSEVLHPIIERGRAAATDPRAAELERRMAYVEYCSPPPEVACDRGAGCDHGLDTPGCGCDKPEHVRSANPAAGRRIDLDFLMTSQRRSMPPGEYGREVMGWHDKPPGKGQVIGLGDWAAGLDHASEPASPVCLAVVYQSDKRKAAIGLAGQRADHAWHVEVADLVSVARVPARVAAMAARWLHTDTPVCGLVVDPHGFEGACIPDLEDITEGEADGRLVPVGFRPWKPGSAAWGPGAYPYLLKPTATDVAAAYTGFVTSATEAHDLFHRGQEELTVAVLGGTPRPVGDAGEAWARRRSGKELGVDIAPVVAVTLARWGFEKLAPVAEVEPGAWAI